jgi:hypothetical protein
MRRTECSVSGRYRQGDGEVFWRDHLCCKIECYVDQCAIWIASLNRLIDIEHVDIVVEGPRIV